MLTCYGGIAVPIPWCNWGLRVVPCWSIDGQFGTLKIIGTGHLKKQNDCKDFAICTYSTLTDCKQTKLTRHNHGAQVTIKIAPFEFLQTPNPKFRHFLTLETQDCAIQQSMFSYVAGCQRWLQQKFVWKSNLVRAPWNQNVPNGTLSRNKISFLVDASGLCLVVSSSWQCTLQPFGKMKQ